MLGFNPVASVPFAAVKLVTTVYVLAVEAADTAAVSVALTASASLAANDNRDAASASALITASAALNAAEPQDVAAAAVSAITLASLLSTEARDSATFAAALDPALCVLSAIEAADVVSAAVNVVAQAVLLATEPKDTASGGVTAQTLIAFSTIEAQDQAAFNAQIINDIRFAITEPQDAASGTSAIVGNAALLASEAPDSVTGAIHVLWGLVPDTSSVWTAQPLGNANWQDVDPPPTPSNSKSIGLLLGAPLGSAPFAALCTPPSGETIGAVWSVQTPSDAAWSAVNPPPTPSNVQKIGILISAPLGGAPLGGLAPRPAGPVESAIWQEVPQTYNPHQEAA